jgi:hypothetical protein
MSVSLLGFSAFECNALESAFRLSTGREPFAYEFATPHEEGRLIVADADHPGTVETVEGAGRLADTLFIGSLPPSGARAWMMRPVDAQQVMRELDTMASRRDDEANPPVPAFQRSPAPVTARVARAEGVEIRGRRADDGDAFVISRPGGLGPR